MQQYSQQPAPAQQPVHHRPRRGGFARFFRGYLMVVGGVTTVLGLTWLIVRLFVEIGKWMV